MSPDCGTCGQTKFTAFPILVHFCLLESVSHGSFHPLNIKTNTSSYVQPLSPSQWEVAPSKVTICIVLSALQSFRCWFYIGRDLHLFYALLYMQHIGECWFLSRSPVNIYRMYWWLSIIWFSPVHIFVGFSVVRILLPWNVNAIGSETPSV